MSSGLNAMNGIRMMRSLLDIVFLTSRVHEGSIHQRFLHPCIFIHAGLTKHYSHWPDDHKRSEWRLTMNCALHEWTLPPSKFNFQPLRVFCQDSVQGSALGDSPNEHNKCRARSLHPELRINVVPILLRTIFRAIATAGLLADVPIVVLLLGLVVSAMSASRPNASSYRILPASAREAWSRKPKQFHAENRAAINKQPMHPRSPRASGARNGRGGTRAYTYMTK